MAFCMSITTKLVIIYCSILVCILFFIIIQHVINDIIGMEYAFSNYRIKGIGHVKIIIY